MLVHIYIADNHRDIYPLVRLTLGLSDCTLRNIDSAEGAENKNLYV